MSQVWRHKKTPRRIEKLLTALATGASWSKAAAAAGVSVRTVHTWRTRSEDFRKVCQAAVDVGTDRLEDEAFRRAHDGWERPIFQQGAQVGTELVYSDRLMEMLLRGRRPEKFKDRTAVEHSGPNGGPIEMVSVRERIAHKLELLANKQGGVARIASGAGARLLSSKPD